MIDHPQPLKPIFIGLEFLTFSGMVWLQDMTLRLTAMSSFVFFCVTLVLLWCFARCFKLEIITHCANWWRCIFSACQNISTLSFLHFHQSHHEPEFISHCHFPRGRDPMGNEAYEVSLLIKINEVFVLINKTRYVMLAYLLCLRRISGSLQEQVWTNSNPLTMYV